MTATQLRFYYIFLRHHPLTKWTHSYDKHLYSLHYTKWDYTKFIQNTLKKILRTITLGSCCQRCRYAGHHDCVVRVRIRTRTRRTLYTSLLLSLRHANFIHEAVHLGNVVLVQGIWNILLKKFRLIENSSYTTVKIPWSWKWWITGNRELTCVIFSSITQHVTSDYNTTNTYVQDIKNKNY